MALAVLALAASPAAVAQDVDGPMTCRLARLSGSYLFNCQIVVDYATFEDIAFNRGACPSLRELYRRDGRLNFGAVPPENGKVFRRDDEFSLSVKLAYCPALSEVTARVDGRDYTWVLR